jgi:poly-gamma-glutamate synthesis protein (capsule biosynthesis protein)
MTITSSLSDCGNFKKDIVTLTAVGDVMLADSPFRIGHGVRSTIKEKGIQHFTNQIQAVTNNSDLNFANLECVLSDFGRNNFYIGSVEMRGSPSDARLLVESGWQIINIANNHIFQHGYSPYLETINLLKKLNLTVIGEDSVNGSKMVVLKRKNIKFGFIGFSLHYEQYRANEIIPYALRESYNEIITEVRKHAVEFDGILVCSLHWGYEFMNEPSISQQKFAHDLIDSGVSLILGHHAHVVQGVELYKGGLIAYNLGNFIFDHSEAETKDSFVLKVFFNRNGVEEYAIKPVLIGSDWCPRLAKSKEEERIKEHIHKLCFKLEKGDLLKDIELEKLASDYYKKWRLNCYIYFLKSWYKFNPLYFIQSIIRSLLRRMNLIHNP